MKRTVLAVLVIALLGAAIFSLTQSTVAPRPDASPDAPKQAASPTANTTANAPERSVAGAGAATEPPRSSAERPSQAQGVRGVARAPDGSGLAGVRVFLQESQNHDPLQRFLSVSRRLARPPAAVGVTGPDGAFALGLTHAPDAPMELWLLSADTSDQRIGDLALRAGAWLDLGAVTLDPGRTVRGRVEIAGAGLPAPQARVLLEAADAFQDLGRRSLDGGGARTAACDADGNYEFAHVPPRGRFRMSALAPGFARAVRGDLEFGAPEPAVVDFALLGGAVVRGQVVDRDGRGIAGAEIEAFPPAAEPSFTATTDAEGRFVVDGLREGDYRLHIAADGFQALDLNKVAAGGPDVIARLERRAAIAVLVRAPDGAPLRDYRLALRWFFPEQGGQIAAVPEVAERVVHLEPGQDRAALTGIDPGPAEGRRSYVLQVEAEGCARTLSAPFQVDPLVAANVDVTMTRGGTLVGRVLDERGQPVAGAKIATRPAGADEDNPIWRMLASTVPDRITRATATSGADGRFTLPALAHAGYDLEITHPDFCQTRQRDLRVLADGELPVPAVLLRRGAAIRGRTLAGDRPRGQVLVLLTPAVPPPELLGKTADDSVLVRVETVSDNDGSFVLPRRVPPGRYELRARILAGRNAEEDIFTQLQRMQRPLAVVEVPPGADTVEQDVRLQN